MFSSLIRSFLKSAVVFYAANRLTTWAMGTPQTVTYMLADGQLLVSDDGSSQTAFLYGRNLLAERGDSWSYLLRDVTGSVRQTVDEAGAVTLARTYKPFGDILEEQGAYETAFGFLGAQLDQVSGLLYANGRYYDPTTGRYLTPNHQFDPRQPGTLNPYAPLQGPGFWLFVPLVGIIILGRRRKGGPWRILILVLALGVGLTLTGCGSAETPPPPGPTQLALPQPPTLPPTTSTNTPTPTSTSTAGPTPTASTPTSTPSQTPSPLPPTPCPTETNTITPTSTPEIEWLGEFVITHYSFALESDPLYQSDEKVSANGLNETYREGFLFGPHGILDKGTGLAEDGTYITIDWSTGLPQGRDTNFTYGIGGSGGEPEAWRTVATIDSRLTELPEGTEIIIEVYEDRGPFIVKDTGGGLNPGQIDIFVGAITIDEIYNLYPRTTSRVGIVRE